MQVKMVQLSEYGNPGERIQTQYGLITWEQYLNKEKERIAKSPGRVVEIRRGRMSQANQLALFVNHIGANIINGYYQR